jgi:hypothetical protein
MKAENFDKKFNEGKEDIIEDLDLSTARRVNQDQKRINVDFPAWVVAALDTALFGSLTWATDRIGVTRRSIIKQQNDYSDPVL